MELAGRDYFTFLGVFQQLLYSLSYCTVKSNHLSQVWAWKGLMEHPCTRGMRNLDPVHAFRFERSGSIYVQRKQWCTDEAWCKPILRVPAEQMSALALFRPACHDMAFLTGGQPILDWINRFEVWCAPQPVGKHKELQSEFTWLRGIVHHTVPGEYNPGTKVDSLLADLRGLPRQRHDGPMPRNAFPMDTITQLLLGADIAPIPAENLLKIDGITHTKDNRMVRSDTIISRQFLVGQGPPESLLCMDCFFHS